jgi:hypothetical protein
MSALLVFIFTAFYLCSSLLIIKYSFNSYNKWKVDNNNKNIIDYIKYTFSI